MGKLSPSKAHRYLNCTKSLDFDTEFVETEVTRRGTILHDFAEMKLKNEDTREYEKEHKFTDWEYYLINSYIKSVWDEYHLIQAKKIIVEEKHGIRLYDNDINLIEDVVVLAKETASIIDLKTGNAHVDEKDNEQLMFYAYDIAINYPKVKKFRLSISQKGVLRTVIKTTAEVLDYFIDAYDTFDAINRNELTYNPSEKACKYCENKSKCLARAKWILNSKK